jgi:mannose-6-phosphate isomerase-like protein (cupin superfamily)
MSETSETASTALKVLDFRPQQETVFEYEAAPRDPRTEPWRLINIVYPGFAGPPIHLHPHASESFEVIEGTLEIYADGEWSDLEEGESSTVPPLVPHTLRNSGDRPVRYHGAHIPGLGYERFMNRQLALVKAGKVRTFPPKDPRSIIHLAMLAHEHSEDVRIVKPPGFITTPTAMLGKLLGFKLPPRDVEAWRL